MIHGRERQGEVEATIAELRQAARTLKLRPRDPVFTDPFQTERSALCLELSDIDRQILATWAGDFPICERPYAEAAAQLGIGEAELLARLEPCWPTRC